MAQDTAPEDIKLREDEVLFLNRQIASMARLGMPLAKGLRILARDVTSEDLRRVVEGIQQDLDEGHSLQEALAKYPRTFSRIHLEVVRAGESTGNLAVILEELNAHTEAMVRVRSRILEAITYPAVISAVIFAFASFFLYAIAPQFESMLIERSGAAAASANADPLAAAPPLTRYFFALSHLVQNQVAMLLLVACGVALAAWTYVKIERMGREYDDFFFRPPLFGKLFLSAALMKVTRTMRDLLLNGVSMVETLRLSSGVVGRNRISRKLEELRLAVEEGGSFSRNLAGDDVFPEAMVWKLQMAEEKGILEEALAELANEFEADVDQQTTLITKVLSPILLVVMGGVVFLMFLACFEPLTESAALMGG
ncbi:MAG: type II secretion system F family protein [Planctomycetota bacterium]|nr:MAG: type II secretion system F family protein [Planctomycetota bacterium]